MLSLLFFLTFFFSVGVKVLNDLFSSLELLYLRWSHFFILMFLTIKFSDKTSFALRSYHIVQGSCIWRPRQQTVALNTVTPYTTKPTTTGISPIIHHPIQRCIALARLATFYHPNCSNIRMTSGGVSLWLTPFRVGCASGRGILSIPSRALFRYDGVCEPHVIPIATMVYGCYRSPRSHLDSS